MKSPNVTYFRQSDLRNTKNDLKLGKNDLKWDFPLGGLTEVFFYMSILDMGRRKRSGSLVKADQCWSTDLIYADRLDQNSHLRKYNRQGQGMKIGQFLSEIWPKTSRNPAGLVSKGKGAFIGDGAFIGEFTVSKGMQGAGESFVLVPHQPVIAPYQPDK